VVSLKREFSFGFGLNHEPVKDSSQAACQGKRTGVSADEGGGEMQANSSCNTFYNERKSGFVKWPLLPDREEQKQALASQHDRPAGGHVSAGIELVATHNRLLENRLKAENDSQSWVWGGSRLRDEHLSCFNWTVFSSP
jgi:hypothetical protein